MFPETVDAASVTLRRLSREHVDVHALYERFAADSAGVEAVFEYVPQEPYETPNDAREFLLQAEDEWDDRESAQYAVRADGDLAGYAGLFVEWERRAARVGVTLDRPFWGEGYASDAADALAELAFETLDLDVVAIGYERGNERSERFVESFVERHGGQYDGVLRNWTRVGDDVLDHHRYTVTREQYEA
ncbi:GNAT family N-acetyltransferase [Halobacterium hubeiense]|uniref:GNAT family N-acetyltransferase n=1 Tax=Halobacterium hubeiense TaxID=1407499 RepID=UPI003C71B1CC